MKGVYLILIKETARQRYGDGFAVTNYLPKVIETDVIEKNDFSDSNCTRQLGLITVSVYTLQP